MQLLLRGDILVIAPSRRLEPAAARVLIVGLYSFGYFLRLAVINHISMNGGPASVRRYLSEEKLVALSLSMAILGLISVRHVRAI